MKGRRTRFRKNDDLLPWRDPAAKKKQQFFNARALISREIMRFTSLYLALEFFSYKLT